MKHIKYASYVVRHKWFVLLECVKLGIPFRGLTHDWHKMLPREWFPYVNFFYGKKTPRDSSGYYKPTDTGDQAFDKAWLHHQKLADHHWQWWILPEDEGGVKILPMSDNARREMLADWRGASKAQGFDGKDDLVAWYEKNKGKMQLHPETREWIESQL